MKKTVLALMAAAALASSCAFTEDVFMMTNVNQFVTVGGNSLLDDYGTVFTVTEDYTDGAWKTEGQRLYILFDILNRDYEISLTAYAPAVIQNMNMLSDVPLDTADPVVISDSSVSPNAYLNLVLEYYALKDGAAEHSFELGYIDDGNTLALYLTHEGAGENPAAMDSDLLVSDSVFLSFPISGIVPSGESRTITLRADVLTKDADGNYSVTRKTGTLYSTDVQF